MRPTTETGRELKLNLKESVYLLKQMADEIRVDLHLGGMEAKAKWGELEPFIERAELAAEKATAASKKAVEESVSAFREFRKNLKAKTPPARS